MNLDLINKIRDQFTDENAKKFLNKFWYDRRKTSGIFSTGFCYLASFAYYSLEGEKDNLIIKRWLDSSRNGHFWLEDKHGKRIDITGDQYPEGFHHYSDGKIVKYKERKRTSEFTKLIAR